MIPIYVSKKMEQYRRGANGRGSDSFQQLPPRSDKLTGVEIRSVTQCPRISRGSIGHRRGDADRPQMRPSRPRPRR